MLFEVIVAALVIMSASLAGVIFIQRKAEQFLESKLSYLVSFSAGVFLITAGGLGLEVFELVSSVWVGALLISSGYILAWAVHFILPETHHHHDEKCGGSKEAARKLMIGDGIHNVADGVVLVVAFSASPALGLAATISIFIHEALQEVSEFFVFRQAGYSVKKALTINYLISATIFIGVALGYFALASEKLEIALLAVSAGFFLHIVIHDLLPKRSSHNDSGTFFKHLAIVLIGVLLMGSIATYLGESHSHGEEDSHVEHDQHDQHDH